MAKVEAKKEDIKHPEPTGNPNRNEAMSAILERARAAREKSVEEDGNLESTGDPEVPERQEANDHLENETSSNEIVKEVNGDTTGDDDDLVTLVIDGEERQVPEKEVFETGIRSMQKLLAADKRLAEATQIRKEADAYREQQLAQSTAQLRAASAAANPTGNRPSHSDDEIKTAAQKIVDLLAEGEDEQAAEAMSKFLEGAGNSQKVDVNEVALRAAKQVQEQTDINKARKDFVSNFKEIAADEGLWQLADQEAGRIKRNNPTLSIHEVLQKAGEAITERYSLKGFTPDQQDPGDQDMNTQASAQDKLGQKRTMEKLPVASARQEKPKPERPPTRSEIVARMKHIRGQNL